MTMLENMRCILKASQHIENVPELNILEQY